MDVLTDRPGERAVLAGICQFGVNCYLDIADIVREETFSNDYNKVIYSTLKHAFEKHGIEHIDLSVIYSSGAELGLSETFNKTNCAQHIKSLFNYHVTEQNIRKHAAKIRKLEIARLLRERLKEASKNLLDIEGTESIASILGIAESTIFDFASAMNKGNDGPTKISEGITDFVKHLAENPVDQLGIPTGFPNYDQAIGGGLRPGINVIGARGKVGKTTLGVNIGQHIAQRNIPVLNLDTEMSKDDHIFKSLAKLSQTPIHDIETGSFFKNPKYAKTVFEHAKKMEEQDSPYFHDCIAGMPFEEQIAIMRRWLVQHVGLDQNGHANECVIVYDYLKLMTSETLSASVQEFQALGFMMTALHNFCVRYKVPILLFIQLNRDGINSEDTNAASGSDRIIWLCSNFTIYKHKSAEEIAVDGANTGNRKLVPVISRHGAGLESGDYINCFMNANLGSIVEGKTRFELEADRND